jgi:hypothetical protein
MKIYTNRTGEKFIKHGSKFVKIDAKKLNGKLLSKSVKKVRRGRTA